jgi:ribose 5-phosphate isomerase B
MQNRSFTSEENTGGDMLVLANDHGGLILKQPIIEVLDEMKLPYKDLGTNSAESTDYPIWGYKAALLVASGECDRGILVCGTGIGISLAANKVQGIRCAVCSDCFSAKMSRAHNNANMLALGGRVIGPDLAKMIVRMWLETTFEGGRHQRRVDMIMGIEQGNVPV